MMDDGVQPIPERVIIAPGESLPVRQVPRSELGGRLGYYDPNVPEILVAADEPEVGKHDILLHEILHAIAETLVTQGLIARHPDHKFVEYGAMALLAVLSHSGLYTGCTGEAVDEWVYTLQQQECDDTGA